MPRIGSPWPTRRRPLAKKFSRRTPAVSLKRLGVKMLRCFISRGLVKEVEEEVNKFLEAQNVNVLHMTQSENGEYLSVTLLYELLAPMPE